MDNKIIKFRKLLSRILEDPSLINYFSRIIPFNGSQSRVIKMNLCDFRIASKYSVTSFLKCMSDSGLNYVELLLNGDLTRSTFSELVIEFKQNSTIEDSLDFYINNKLQEEFSKFQENFTEGDLNNLYITTSSFNVGSYSNTKELFEFKILKGEELLNDTGINSALCLKTYVDKLLSLNHLNILNLDNYNIISQILNLSPNVEFQIADSTYIINGFHVKSNKITALLNFAFRVKNITFDLQSTFKANFENFVILTQPPFKIIKVVGIDEINSNGEPTTSFINNQVYEHIEAISVSHTSFDGFASFAKSIPKLDPLLEYKLNFLFKKGYREATPVNSIEGIMSNDKAYRIISKCRIILRSGVSFNPKDLLFKVK